MRTLIRLLFTLCMLALVIAAGVWVWNYYSYTPWTRDGRVRADVTTIAPDVSGWIDTLNVQDNQHVNKGDVLFRIDRVRYQASLDQANAAAEQARVRWQQALDEYQRRQRLSSQSISREDLQNARLSAAAAEASYHASQAQVETAKINLSRTEYRAPASGHIVNLSLRQGDYVSQGTPQMSLVRDHSYYITGYFEETKIDRIKPGEEARVWLMSHSKSLNGHVVSIGRGISNSDTSKGNDQLPTVSPTFTWVRLAQRIPVDIHIDHVPEGVVLSSGMTATVRVYNDRHREHNEQADLQDSRTEPTSLHDTE
ncbi:efflux RND transporter periplasmic adaptor subunit [Carnimonas nigrificans]|uniref:efflux RND transporter periplasmic adaptor subunit n=1 Tax=Carnimonas nigrificans TaxID=64323 RepID=UPI00046F99C3|nr:HlyD family secretion protein [Carnimonas nigrificans]